KKRPIQFAARVIRVLQKSRQKGFRALPPLPVLRERAGVRVISNVERLSKFQITLTLSRSTGRGDQIVYAHCGVSLSAFRFITEPLTDLTGRREIVASPALSSDRLPMVTVLRSSADGVASTFPVSFWSPATMLY